MRWIEAVPAGRLGGFRIFACKNSYEDCAIVAIKLMEMPMEATNRTHSLHPLKNVFVAIISVVVMVATLKGL